MQQSNTTVIMATHLKIKTTKGEELEYAIPEPVNVSDLVKYDIDAERLSIPEDVVEALWRRSADVRGYLAKYYNAGHTTLDIEAVYSITYPN